MGSLDEEGLIGLGRRAKGCYRSRAQKFRYPKPLNPKHSFRAVRKFSGQGSSRVSQILRDDEPCEEKDLYAVWGSWTEGFEPVVSGFRV